MIFNSIEEGIQDLKEGSMVIIINNEGYENEGNLVIPAELVTEENIDFMIKHARGLVWAPMEEEIAVKLGLYSIIKKSTDNNENAFTVSIDHKDTVTGISAFEIAYTINKLSKSKEKSDFRMPGHVFPLIAKRNGVFDRKGNTEAAIDLVKLGGFKGAAVTCEITKVDGTMTRNDDLIKFAKEYNIKILTIEDLIKFKRRKLFKVL